jgi:hypothetical protein
MYTIRLNVTTGNILDIANPVASAEGPNGESYATLQSAGWNVTATSTSITVTRGTSVQNNKPLAFIHATGIQTATGAAITRFPSGATNITFTVIESTSGGNYTGFDFYKLDNTTTGANYNNASGSTGPYCIIVIGIYS